MRRPLELRLTLRDGNSEYPAGTHTVSFSGRDDRYEEQLCEFARIVRGDIENPWTCDHDETVQETVLAAAGYLQLQED